MSVDRRRVQSHQHRIPVDRIAYSPATAVHRLPHQQQLLAEQHALLFVPSEGLPEHEQSATRSRGIPDDVRTVPRHHRVDGFDFQSQQHGFPANRFAHGAAARMHAIVTSTTITRRFRRTAIGCHHDRLQQHDQSGTPGAAAVLPHDVPELPQHNGLDWRDVQSHAVHAVPDKSRQRQQRLLNVPYQLEQLLDLPVHRLPWRQQRRTISITTMYRDMSTTASTATNVIRTARAADRARHAQLLKREQMRRRQTSGGRWGASEC